MQGSRAGEQSSCFHLAVLLVGRCRQYENRSRSPENTKN